MSAEPSMICSYDAIASWNWPSRTNALPMLRMILYRTSRPVFGIWSSAIRYILIAAGYFFCSK
jgi:hypothetical protein